MSSFENTPKTFGEMWTYSRTGAAIYVPDVDGLLIQSSANVAPINHKGLLLERSVTNQLLHSRDMSDDQPVWDGPGMTTGDRLLDQIGADGTADAATWVRDADGATSAYIRQFVTINPDHYGDADITYPHTFSVYILKTESATVCPAVYLGYPLDEIEGGFAINTNTGVATRVTALGSDGSCVVESSGDWWRVAVTIGIPNQPDEIELEVRLYPAISSTSTPGTAAVAMQGSAVFDFAQLEANSPVATSAIVNGATLNTRAEATLTHSALDDIALTDVTALIEYSDAVYLPWDMSGGGSIVSPLLYISDGSSPTPFGIIQLGVRSTLSGAGNCYAYARNSGSTSDASRYFDFAASGKLAASYSQERNESNTAANGVGKTIAGDGTTYTPQNITLKANIMAYIQKAEIYMHAKSASELATLTAA